MSQNFSQNNVQSALGYYFKTPDLLSASFTPATENDTENNGGLIFLGERLLDFVISDYLFSHYPFSAEKELLRRMGEIKKALNYQSFVSEKGLSKYIYLSAKSESLRESKALHGEIFLSLLAAMYKDGGLPSLKAFLLPLLRAADKQEHFPPQGAAKESGVRDTSFEEKRHAETSSVLITDAKAEANQKKEENKKASEEKPSEKNKKETKTEKKTVEKSEEKSGRLGVNLIKAIKLPSLSRKKDTEVEEKKPTKAKEPEAKDTEVKEQRRSFIRDALAPVTLPESMKNPKPRKPYKNSSDNAPEEPEKTQKTEVSYTDDSENYKSLLQEYVQKNIRSANVLLKYNTERRGNGFVTEITLDGKSLAKAEGTVKKLSEKAAAKIAYEELNSLNSSLYLWFSSVCEQGLNVQKAPDNYISRLNEYYQKKSHSSSAPLTYEPRPSREKKTFSVAIIFNGEELAVGTAHTVKDARQDAARQVCEKLKI